VKKENSSVDRSYYAFASKVDENGSKLLQVQN